MNPMSPIELPVYAVKNRVSALLAEVQKAMEYVITNRGVPVACLVPYQAARPAIDGVEYLARIREMRKGSSLGGSSIKELINEGRKY